MKFQPKMSGLQNEKKPFKFFSISVINFNHIQTELRNWDDDWMRWRRQLDEFSRVE